MTAVRSVCEVMTTHGLCMVIISLFGTAVLALAEATLNLLHLALIVVLLLCDTTSIFAPSKTRSSLLARVES